jgi:hypothetical protein
MKYGEFVKYIEGLFAKQVADRAILTDDLCCGRESGHGSAKKTVVIEGHDFNLLYVRSRCLRHDQALLTELGIRPPNTAKFYEFDPASDSPYVEYITEESYRRLAPEARRHAKATPFFNYFETNPKAKSLAVNLHGKDGSETKFNVVANLAPFCENHYLVWPEPQGNTGLKQIYHESMLYWIDDLFCRIGAGYSLFFSANGSGNSINTLHFQVLALPFPAFDCLDRYYKNRTSPLIRANTRAWPLPGIFVRYHSAAKDEPLAEFDRCIRDWLSLDSARTFNLLFRIEAATGIREAFFIYRKKQFTRLSGVDNEFAGCEAGGNIIIENREDYERFPDKTERLELVNRGNGLGSEIRDKRFEIGIAAK